MVIRKKKIKINGKEIEVDAFDTSLIPGSGTEEEAIECLLKEEEIEKEIKSVIEKIKKMSERHPNKHKNTLYYYEVGQVLQFVNKKQFTYLFSLKPDYKCHIGEGAVTDELRKAFVDKKRTLSSDAKISKIDAEKWKVVDGTKTYTIEDAGTQLNIYQQFERGKIWQRLAYDLEPELFDGKKKNPNEAKRYPEFMYLLAKINKKHLNKVSWDQWYEILKFKEIYKDENLLVRVLSECANNNLSGIPLRNKIKQLRKSMRQQNAK